MNVRRFTARTSRDALGLVRQALGEDAVVLSTKPCADGVEVLAMAPEGMRQIERMAAQAPAAAALVSAPVPVAVKPPAKSLAARSAARADAALTTLQPAPSRGVEDDVATLSMSTLSFQDYVRERMLKRRKAAMTAEAATHAAAARAVEPPAERASVLEQRMNVRGPVQGAPLPREPHAAAPQRESQPAPLLREPPVLRDSVQLADDIHVPGLADAHIALPRNVALPAHAAMPAAAAFNAAHARRDQEDMLSELRQVRGLIEERFGALAFMEKLQRQPKQALLTQKLLDSGFSPALIRKIGDSLPADVVDAMAWAAGILERNLVTAEAELPLEDQGGVYALVGATGVGKTTTTAKIAAAFATKYGAANLGLITLDAYRIGAHEQLRAYGRILGVPVHTAHDRASLEDLLDLLAGKKMVLIDTAGMAQRDARTRELLDMLRHRAIRKLLVVNAASQGETIEDVMVSYRASTCAGIVLSKMDEAVKLGPALDALIRNKLKLVGVANGQRVPEDWHRLSANALVHRALRCTANSAYKLDASDVSLIFTAPISHPVQRVALHA
ncbi:MAG: flagellar biosynthesis protein FlhF [Bacteriovorax sp.]|nr:flagellar biosynthesis protein FlhF [Rhizobacter sp.]